MNHFTHTLLIAFFCMALSSCGQKGPLILPEDVEQGQAGMNQSSSAQPEENHVALSLQK